MPAQSVASLIVSGMVSPVLQSCLAVSFGTHDVLLHFFVECRTIHSSVLKCMMIKEGRLLVACLEVAALWFGRRPVLVPTGTGTGATCP